MRFLQVIGAIKTVDGVLQAHAFWYLESEGDPVDMMSLGLAQAVAESVATLMGREQDSLAIEIRVVNFESCVGNLLVSQWERFDRDDPRRFIWERETDTHTSIRSKHRGGK